MNRKFVTVSMIAALLVLAMGGLFPLHQAQAQGQYSWTGQYYNNPVLNGEPALVRTDNALAFNFGLGSPATGINPDNFSVRWGADVSLSPGNYRFYALADDNIRVTFNFDNTPVIDTFANPQVGVTVQGDVQVTQAGVYHLQVDYREVTDNAYAYVSFQNLATNPNSPNFSAPTPPIVVNTGNWMAQYYSNPTLTGDPVAIVSEANPSRDFGAGSPAANVPVDNWSARWTSTQNLPAGNYVVSLRVDDGARISFNGVNVINAFTPATGAIYSANIYLSGGNTQIVIEYFELGGNAFLDYRLEGVNGSVQVAPTAGPTQSVSPTGLLAVVNAARLNVRETPSIRGRQISQVSRGDQFPALARSNDSGWVQINASGIVGWVSSAYVSLIGAGNLPTGGAIPGTSVPSGSGLIVTATPYTVNMRSGPSTAFARVARLPAGQTATVIGRNAANQWYQVSYNGIIGWVTAQYAVLQAGADINSIPVTG